MCHCARPTLAFTLVLAAATQLPAAPPASQATAELVAVLASDRSTTFDKAKACQVLARVGDASAVPALLRLLADEQLSGYARHALEEISDPAASAALRTAADDLEGELLVGVLDSLGRKRDEQAVSLLSSKLEDDDPAVARAAARSLGEVGNQESAGVLQEALSNSVPARRDVIAQAALIAAQRLLQEDESAAAVELLDIVRAAQVPQYVKSAATYDALIARGPGDQNLLREQLQSDDASFRVALQAARTLGRDAVGVLTGSLNQLAADRQILVVDALADIGGERAIQALRQMAETDQSPSRLASLSALGALGDKAALPLLAASIRGQDPAEADVALLALARFPSEAANSIAVELLARTDDDVRSRGIELAARRRVEEAAPQLWKLAESESSEATLALGSTIPAEDFTRLLQMAIGGSADSATSAAAREAVRVACFRLPQQPCVEAIAAATDGADDEASAFLIDQLASVGGEDALRRIAEAAQSDRDALQDAATRVLGEWLSADAAPTLYQLAQSLEEERYQIRALRGYIRIARQLDMSLEARMEVCRNALMLAERADEQQLVLEVLRRNPTLAGLEMATSLLEGDAREPAASAVVAIAEPLLRSAESQAHAAQVREALQQVVDVARRSQTVQAAEQLLQSAEVQP